MRKINVVILALVAIYLLATPLTAGQGGNPPASTKESGATSGKGMTAAEQTGESGGNVEAQIKALSDQLAQAYIKGDTSFWEKYLSDDYIGVYASGQKYTKSESVQPGALKYESFDVRESNIRVYGNTAVVNQLTSAKGTVRKDGKPFSGLYRTTRVWVREKDGWKLVAFQATQVP